MFEDFFIIPPQKVDKHWKQLDLSFEFFALEYCEEILKIPIFYIEYTGYGDNGLEISLKELQNISILRENWYIQLGLLSFYARAS
ncbi:MAG: hypothetical protein QM493_00880 [Sulfurovum sp.]